MLRLRLLPFCLDCLAADCLSKSIVSGVDDSSSAASSADDAVVPVAVPSFCSWLVDDDWSASSSFCH